MNKAGLFFYPLENPHITYRQTSLCTSFSISEFLYQGSLPMDSTSFRWYNTVVFITEKNTDCVKWVHAVQIHVVKESTVNHINHFIYVEILK